MSDGLKLIDEIWTNRPTDRQTDRQTDENSGYTGVSRHLSSCNLLTESRSVRILEAK